MENEIKNNENKGGVHAILANSYALFFVLLLVGILLDLIFRFRIFQDSVSKIIGIFFMIFASLLILWSQKTSRKLKIENVTKETFLGGPYKYTRSPTHWGLFFMIFGFGLVMNAFFIILSSFISFFVSKLFFLKKEEKLLARKYGEPYMEYKKSVKL